MYVSFLPLLVPLLKLFEIISNIENKTRPTNFKKYIKCVVVFEMLLIIIKAYLNL